VGGVSGALYMDQCTRVTLSDGELSRIRPSSDLYARPDAVSSGGKKVPDGRMAWPEGPDGIVPLARRAPI
jgi:hypothetical protein